MKRFFLCNFFLLSIVFGFSQTTKYDLSKYKLPNYGFRSLDNSFLFFGNYRQGQDAINPSRTYSQSVVNLDWSTEFRKLKNTRAEQTDIFVSSQLNYQRMTANKTNSNSNTNVTVFSDFDRRFFHEKEVFTGLGHRLLMLGSRNHTGLQFFRIKLHLPFSVGIGRIENVTDAWQSVRILEDLKRFALLKETPSEEKITELAAFISERQNLRFFDSRLKRIEDIEELDAFLKSEGLADECNAEYFNSLSDQWLFGVNEMRQSGSAFTFRLSPYGTLASGVAGRQGNIGFGGVMSLEYFRAKPLTLKHQLDLTAAIFAGGYVNGVPNPVTGLDGERSIEPKLKAVFGYYPTSRTSITTRMSAVYKISDNSQINHILIAPITDEFDQIYSLFHENGLRLIGEFNTQYYLSPQTRLEAGINSTYIENHQSSTCGVSADPNSSPRRDLEINCLHFNYRIQFTHSFF